MKLCYLADAKNIHTKKWVSFFADRKHEVHLISFLKSNIPNIIFHPFKITWPVHISHMAPIYTKIGYLFYIRKVKNLIQQIAPDIVHAHWATSYGLLGACSGFHPFLISTWGRDIYKASAGSFFYKKIINYSLNKADVVTATSIALARETAKYIQNDKVSVQHIPFGIDINSFLPSAMFSNKDTITIGIAKKLEYYYGIEYLIAAVAKVSQQLKNVHLLIVGDGSQREYLKNLAQKLCIAAITSFTGNVPHEKILNYLHQIDIFVVPSLIESFGVVALEASACGIPVIASNVGGLPEVVVDGKTGFLVPPKNPDAIAEKILLLAIDFELRKSMGQMARKFVEDHYVWEENASRMEQLYRDLLKSKKSDGPINR